MDFCQCLFIGGSSISLSSGDTQAPQAPTSPLPDKVYVECKNGFATTPRGKMFHTLNYNGDNVDVENSKSAGTPLELAILVQKWCRPFYTLCHGLLGGMALLHIIMVSLNPADCFKFHTKLL
jgi:hypothetical protein